MPNTNPFLLGQPGRPIDLEEVFVYFATMFEGIPGPRAVAEAQISKEDIGSLTKWFSALYGKPRNWCERDWPEELIGGESASSREMFGALFLILSSEVCRDQCGEESVWPTVSQLLQADKLSFPMLFAGGQPTEACKLAMTAGARRLNLRNLIDRYGTQEYFDTLKLQFGFTIQGARRRISDWLDGLSCPIAVNILRGIEEEYADLGSVSFQRLWTTLNDLRRRRIKESDAFAILDNSPWVRSEWIPELMREATQTTPTSVEPSVPTDSSANQSDAIFEPILRWDFPSRPRILLQLNESRILEILEGANNAVFSVDGRVVARWTAQSANQWSGPRTIPCEPETAKNKPNFRPKLLLVTTDEGTTLAEVSLQEISTHDPISLFNIGTGLSIDPQSFLDRENDFALVCDSDLVVVGSDKFISLDKCSVYYLIQPLPENLKVIAEDATFWQPITRVTQPKVQINLTVTCVNDSPVEIDGKTNIAIDGIPEETDSAILIAGGSHHQVCKNNGAWETQTPVSISLKIALGDERIKIRLSSTSSTRSVIPRLALQLRGVVALEATSGEATQSKWVVVNRSRPLNLSGGASHARIFVPGDKAELYEGPRLVGKVSSRALSFKDFFGWGWPLQIPSQDDPLSILVGSVEDRGCVGLYLPNLLGKPINKIYLRSPIQPSPGHAIHAWHSLDASATVISGESIECGPSNFEWRIPSLSQPIALAISYDGAWLGSYANSSLVCESLRRLPRARSFALARWLKLPIMNDSFRNEFQRAVFRAPVEFIRGWLDKEQLPSGLVFREPDSGADAILRWMFWDYIDDRQDRLEEIAQSFSSAQYVSGAEAFMCSLVLMSEISPSLAYCFARAMVRSEKYRQYLRRVVAQVLRQPSTTTVPLLKEALRVLTARCAVSVRSDLGILQEAVSELGDNLDRRISSSRDTGTLLRRLGELSLGRRQLTASLLSRVLERRFA